MKTLEIVKNKDLNRTYIIIDGLLEQEDYDLFWKGGESNDGSEGEFSDTLNLIQLIYENYLKKPVDFNMQIWGKGQSSFCDNIDETRIEEMKDEFRAYFSDIEFDEYEI